MALYKKRQTANPLPTEETKIPKSVKPRKPDYDDMIEKNNQKIFAKIDELKQEIADLKKPAEPVKVDPIPEPDPKPE